VRWPGKIAAGAISNEVKDFPPRQARALAARRRQIAGRLAIRSDGSDRAQLLQARSIIVTRCQPPQSSTCHPVVTMRQIEYPTSVTYRRKPAACTHALPMFAVPDIKL